MEYLYPRHILSFSWPLKENQNCPALSTALSMLSLIFCSAKLWMISLTNKTNYSFCSGEWQSKGEAFGAGLSA